MENDTTDKNSEQSGCSAEDCRPKCRWMYCVRAMDAAVLMVVRGMHATRITPAFWTQWRAGWRPSQRVGAERAQTSRAYVLVTEHMYRVELES